MNLKKLTFVLQLTLLIVLSISLTSCDGKTNIDKEEKIQVMEKEYPILKAGSIEVLDSNLSSVIPLDAKIEIIAEGHEWTEGPLWVESKKMLLYSDIPRNAVYSWQEGETAKVYLKPSGFLGDNFTGVEPGANGLLLDKDGSLVLCQHGMRQVAKMNSTLDSPNPKFTTLASKFEGKRFNSPNDAVYKSNGDLYITDPPYGLPKQMDDPEKEISFQGVYRLDADGNVFLLTDELTRPNGIAFSLDEKTLYVANSDPKMAIWKAFDVDEDGNISNGRIFFDATSMVPNEKGLPDGLKVDNNGNLFATGPGGVLIFNPEGKLLGKIKTGEATSNCAFNNDKTILYVTADAFVLRVKLK